jgi:hypothetical protein
MPVNATAIESAQRLDTHNVLKKFPLFHVWQKDHAIIRSTWMDPLNVDGRT